MSTTHDRYEARALHWDAAGRPPSALASGYDLIALRCWSYSDGAGAEGFSDLLKAFIRASEQAQPEEWLDAYLSDRESCGVCGEGYRFENLSLCTACRRRHCWRCVPSGARAANGNPLCACGNGEVVG